MFRSQSRHFLVIDGLRILAHAIRDDFVGLAGKVELVAVRQVAAVRQVQAENRVAGLQHRGVRCLVGLRSRVRLHVNVFRAENFLAALARQVLHHVGELAAAIVALARIALGVLVGEDAGSGLEHGFGGEILAGDQLELRILPFHFMLDSIVNLRVDLGQRPRHTFRFRHCAVSSPFMPAYISIFAIFARRRE